MTTQLSNCCKATIDLDKTKDRPECFTCSKCGRIIGSPLPSQQEVEKAISNILICCCKNRGDSEHCKECGKRTVKAQVREILTSLTEAHNKEMEKMASEIYEAVYDNDSCTCFKRVERVAKKFNIEVKE